MPGNEWDEITYPFLNVNGTAFILQINHAIGAREARTPASMLFILIFRNFLASAPQGFMINFGNEMYLCDCDS